MLKTLLEFYPVMLPVVIVCIIFNAVSSIPSIFMQKIIAIVEKAHRSRLEYRRMRNTAPCCHIGDIYVHPLQAVLYITR